MSSGTHLGLEEWLPRRAIIVAGLGLWVAGFAAAGAVAWTMQASKARTGGVPEMATTTELASELSGPAAAILMPGDVIVARQSAGQAGDAPREP